MLLEGLAALVTLVFIRSGANALIKHGLRPARVAHKTTPADFGLQGVAVRIPSGGDASMFAWFIPASSNAKAPAVVVMHGWGANASLMLPAASPLHHAGFSVLLLDARCHGDSDNAAFTSLPRFSEDLEAGLDWLSAREDVDGEQICAIGHSVGAGAALLSATRRPELRAVVSISAFAHPVEVMRRWLDTYHIPYPVLGWYVMRYVQQVIGYRFDDIAPLKSIACLHCPVLLVHGTGDTTVPFNDALRLQAAGIQTRVQILPLDADHDPTDALGEQLPAIIYFLQKSLAPALSSTTYVKETPCNQRQKNQ